MKSIAISKKAIIAIVASVAALALIIGGVLIGSSMSTKEMQKAIENKSAAEINAAYGEARGTSKQAKYDKLIGELLGEIKNDINAHDYSNEASANGGQAVYDYLESRWKELVVSDYDTIEGSVSSTNQPQWDEIMSLVESKEAYCQGIYSYKTEKDYKKAIEYFSGTSEDDSSFEESKNMTGECVDAYINETLKKVDEFVANGDVSGGISLLEAAKKYLDECGINSEQISAKIDEVLKNYADSYAKKAEEALKNKDANAAIGNIEVAMKLQPDNAEYRSRYDEYQQYLPFELYKESNILNTENSKDFHGLVELNKKMTSNDNREMPHCIRWYNNGLDFSASYDVIYNLQGKYDVVKGTEFMSDENKSTPFKGSFKAYGDGKLLYTSPVFTAGVLPQDISFNVAGVQKLKISFIGQGEDGLYSLSGTPHFGVSNLVAQKNFPE